MLVFFADLNPPCPLLFPMAILSISHFVLFLPFVSLRSSSCHQAAPERSGGVASFPVVGRLPTQAPAQGLVPYVGKVAVFIRASSKLRTWFHFYFPFALFSPNCCCCFFKAANSKEPCVYLDY